MPSMSFEAFCMARLTDWIHSMYTYCRSVTFISKRPVATAAGVFGVPGLPTDEEGVLAYSCSRDSS